MYSRLSATVHYITQHTCMGYPSEVGALFTTVSNIRVSRVRVTLTVTVRVSRVSIMVSVRDSIKYEGRPINKLQNGIILLIFKI